MRDPVDIVAAPLFLATSVIVAAALVAVLRRCARWLGIRWRWTRSRRRLGHVAHATVAVGAVAGIVEDPSRVQTQWRDVDPETTTRLGELPVLASGAVAVGSLDVLRRRRRDAMRALLGGQVPDAPAPDVVALRRLLHARERHFDRHRAEHEQRHLLPVGMSGDELVSIPLTPGRRVVIGHRDESTTRSVLRHLANVVATAPWLDGVRVVTCGMSPDDVIDTERVHFVSSMDDAWNRAREITDARDDLTVVIVDASGRHVIGDPVPGVVTLSLASEGLVPNDPDTDVLRHGERGWRLETRGRSIVPFTAKVDDVATLRRGVDPEPSRPLHATSIDHEWSVMMQVLGPLQAVDRNGVPLTFEKSKSLEFLAWLCMHPDRPTPVGARTALWDDSVQDSTFNNVVSDLRRALHMVTNDEVRWPIRPSTNRYELGPHVVTDVDLLLDAIATAEQATPRETVRLICDRLANVRGMPFEGMVSDWADCEGITSNIVMIVVAAASLAARLALTLDDDESVLLATSHGLRMLPGHEELVSLRLLVHERRGERGAGRLYRADKESTGRVR
jgi:hypothetical protein